MKNQLSAVFVSYAFPPNGGSGVQRVYKFVKYLPRFGIATSVLTAKNILKSTADTSMLSDLDPKTVVIRTLSIDPMFVADLVNRGIARPAVAKKSDSFKKKILKKLLSILLKVRNIVRLPDHYIGWFPFALFAGFRHVKNLQNAVIVASLPVYTTALIAYCISKLTGAPLILDFRDAWADDPYLELPTRFHHYFHNKLENIIVKHAKHIVVYGEWLQKIYLRKYPEVPATVILNGFDEEDFQFITLPSQKNDKFRLVYSGSIFKYHREFIEMVFKAIQQLDIDLRNQVELVFAGEIQLTKFDELVQKFGLGAQVTRLGYIPHKEAIKLLISADALLFTIPKDDVSSYTGKIFEYLAAKRPIISFVCEHGCGGELLKEFGHARWLVDYDSERATEVFESIAEFRKLVINCPPDLLGKIERKHQALAFSEIIYKVANMRN